MVSEEKTPFYTFEGVQERLVEAMKFWWRVEGGAWPFASDGPWHLIRRDEGKAAEAEAILNAMAEGRPVTPDPKPVPLSLDEIARRDEATEWYLLVPERDRQLVQIAVVYLAKGYSQVPWTKVRAKMRAENGTRALGMRYSRAVARIAKSLNSLKSGGDGVSRVMVTGA